MVDSCKQPEVVPFNRLGRVHASALKDEKRLAVQIVAQLPEDPRAARRVLDHARRVVDIFLDDDRCSDR